MHLLLNSSRSHVEQMLHKKPSKKVLQEYSFTQPLVSWLKLPPLSSYVTHRPLKSQMVSTQIARAALAKRDHSNLADLLGPKCLGHRVL